MAWQEAVESTNPFAKEILDFTSTTESDPTAFVSSIRQTLTRNKSLFMNRTFSKFKRNLEVLSEQGTLLNLLFANVTVSTTDECCCK